MDFSDALGKLNKKQREAVTADRMNLLILAGAGSGKTRVLVHRIAWLKIIKNCSPYSIMAVTFTNKAAIEMRHRIAMLIDAKDLAEMWIGTFHGLANRLLRTHYIDAKLPKDFQILDSEDQLHLLNRIIKEINLNEKQCLPWKALQYINEKKNKGIRPRHVQNINNLTEQTLQKIYQIYQETCDRSGILDFSELLIRAYELLMNNPYILQCYQKRFTDILIDEFQDTNSIQYSWIHLLAYKTGKVMIVGDDDQSIYGWRGAQIKNINRFLNDFPNSKIISLEQNYRSTSNILNAANALIRQNKERFKKNLWTNRIKGEPIVLYCAFNDIEEANFVINCIKIWKNDGGLFKQCAILYRNNSQSRILEETLIHSKIPYYIYGGTRFFERKEIKDALAYLRLISNRNDDVAFERILNNPSRGIGNKTVNIIRQISLDHQLTLWKASHKLLQEKILTSRSANSLRLFLDFIELISKETRNMSLHVQTEKVIKSSGLYLMYKKDKEEKEKNRTENLEELIRATRQFNYKKDDKNLMPLQSFLSYVALESEDQQVDSLKDSVQLMTLHSAKGLEFQQVFIVGMEEGMFPNQMSLAKQDYLEEERRLAYVGLTRAMKKLTLTYTKTRLLHGQLVFRSPSRFIEELPDKYVSKFHLYPNNYIVNR